MLPMSPKPTTAAGHFSRQARAYALSPTHSADADLDIVAGLAAARTDDICLDVATGAGHTALRLARGALFVIGVDIAPGMLAEARRLARDRGLGNTAFLIGDALALPFPAGCFDVVTCRIAAHHFHDAGGFAREAARVLRAGGRLVIEDTMAPDDSEAARFIHSIERERDPTHVRSLTRGEWTASLGEAGLSVTHEETFPKALELGPWLERAAMSSQAALALEERILAAPPALRGRFFDVESGRVTRFNDSKLILRAAKG